MRGRNGRGEKRRITAAEEKVTRERRERSKEKKTELKKK